MKKINNNVKRYKDIWRIIVKNIVSINDNIIIMDILNKAFLIVAEEYNFTKENAPIFPAFMNSDKIEDFLDGIKMYGYKLDDKIIGCAGYSYNKDQTYFIKRLTILPEHRHLGVGKTLLEFIENEIKQLGGKVIEIHVIDKNRILREWYKKLGYIEIRIDELKTLPFNSCTMIKELK
jgi:N-acetylglutamate synthase-like GNAT family acetyltransferase